jgi:hypothetical protein
LITDYRGRYVRPGLDALATVPMQPFDPERHGRRAAHPGRKGTLAGGQFINAGPYRGEGKHWHPTAL